jgi:hypothetical protein
MNIHIFDQNLEHQFWTMSEQPPEEAGSLQKVDITAKPNASHDSLRIPVA